MSAVGTCKSVGHKAEAQSPLRARCVVDGYGRDCRILNIDSRSLFVESFVPPVKGSKVELQFRLPNGHQVCTAGVVSRHIFKVGFDVVFTDLSPFDRDEIDSLLG